jgi:hypothetical protein
MQELVIGARIDSNHPVGPPENNESLLYLFGIAPAASDVVRLGNTFMRSAYLVLDMDKMKLQ